MGLIVILYAKEHFKAKFDSTKMYTTIVFFLILSTKLMSNRQSYLHKQQQILVWQHRFEFECLCELEHHRSRQLHLVSIL